MKLIADAGSTKIEWAVIADSGQNPLIFTTPGLNPALVAADSVADEFALRLSLDLTDNGRIDRCYYYGAGCLPHIIPNVERALGSLLPGTEVHAYSDLLGAARSVFPTGSGIACILGTGSNSAVIADGELTDNIPPLGYILGDEGSGSALGKRLIGDMLKRLLPSCLWDEWQAATGCDYAGLVQAVYRRPEANKFLASQTRFIREHIDVPGMRAMVVEEFGRFLDRNVLRYPHARHLPIGFVGSLAEVFRAELEAAATDRGLRIDKIITRPLQGLIEYHTTH